ncbi:MAG: TrmB family transcriptional regulator, partial [Halobacteriaceae archaeon]
GSLETAGLARSQSASRPAKYVAVEPGVALDRLLADRKRELADMADQYEAVAADLAEELESPRSSERFWTAAVGPAETVDLLVERLDAATDRIDVVAGVPGAGFDIGEVGERVTDRLEAAADRGVAVRVLVAGSLIERVPAGTYQRYDGGLADRDGFAVRVSDGVGGSFVLLDGTEVCIEVPNPLEDDEPFAMIDLTDTAFAADAKAAFERRWDDATPF